MSKAEVKFPSAPDTSAIDIQDEGSLIVSNPDTMNFTGAGVTVTENPTGTAEVNIPGVQFWTESESAATQQNTRWIPNNAATNVTAVIQPKGNGANTAQRPDGTTTGGIARGQFATDWQKNRTAISQVASGNNATISGGRSNLASGNDSTVVGGSSCSATGSGSIAGGDQSSATQLTAISLGSESIASGSRTVVIGRQLTGSGLNSSVFGAGNRVSGTGSDGSGQGLDLKNSNARGFGAGFQASGAGQISNNSGRAQEGCAIMGYNSRLTGAGQPPQLQTTGSLFYLMPGNGTNSGNTQAWVPATTNQQFTLQLKLQATVTAITGTATGINVGDVKQWSIEGSGKIVAGVLTILNSGTTPVILYEDAGLATMAATFIVGTSNSVGVQITNATFAGGGSLELMVNGYLYYQESALN